MAHMVCPWWLGWLLVNPLRRLLQDPRAVLAPFVTPGMTVLEPGPGMGFFTLELARLVGPTGKVVAVDVQPRMLAGLRRRAGKAGVLDRIDARQAPAQGLGIEDLGARIDFVLAFAMVHELPDDERFFAEVRAAMKPAARLLLAEPRGHVKEEDFRASVQRAERAGFEATAGPDIARSRTALLMKR